MRASIPVFRPAVDEAAGAPPDPHADPAWIAHLRREQLTLLARQVTRSPYAIAIACAFVAYSVWGHVPPATIALWALALLAILFARRAAALRMLREVPPDAQRALRQLVALTCMSGVMTGAAAPLFFPPLPYQDRALLTMVLVCWTGGGISTSAAYAPAFYVYVVPALLPLALLWGSTGRPDDAILGVLVVLFGVIQVMFVKDNERVVRDSFLIRYENERLLDALAREREEVLLARDRAEEADRMKSRFLAAASHDLRQPLHALSLFSAALSVRAKDEATHELSEHMDTTLSALSLLLDSLLDISKLDAGAVRPRIADVPIAPLIERIAVDFRAIAEQKRLGFEVSTVPAAVRTDPALLERMLRNLIDNALKYTVRGGIALTVERTAQGVAIAVRDTGPGIPAEERERIFEEFYQIGNPARDRTRGLGLGLAIVRRIASLLDAKLDLQSEVGTGSTFVLTLPAAETVDAPGTPTPTPADPSVLERIGVLVIDDEPAVRIGMRALLESWGCRVTACTDQAEAERLIRQYQPAIDLIIADFRLRAHENGIETVRRLRAHLGDVPALLVTGDTAPERLREAQASGLPLLHKPVAPDKLKEAMIGELHR